MIEAHQISYSHKKTPILKDINFTAHCGELLVIVGPNGAGKSTLLGVLANEMTQKKDRILFKKKTFTEWDSKDLVKNKAKFSQQNSNDIPLSVKDIVMMGRYPYFNATPLPADVEAVEKAMGAMDLLSMETRNYNSLSGGEKQRVHLARVLTQLDNEILHKLIFLDEPLNNLDVSHQHKVLQTVKVFTEKGNTAVVVLHDLNLAAQFADSILLMKKGEIIAHDIPEKVFTKEIISKVYNFPCTICANPITKNPIIIFGT